MEKLDLNAMAMFAKVAELGSFTRAALHMAIPISTVSRRVSQLESRLGVRLLERSTRNLRLTSIGGTYFEHCRRALQELEAANLLVAESEDQVSGVLRLSAPPSIEGLLVPWVAGFQKRYPNARVRVWVTNRRLSLIEDGVDLALRVGKLADSTLIARKLLRYRHVLVAAPSYLADAGRVQHPEEVNHHRTICFGGWHGDPTWSFSKVGEILHQPLAEHLAFNDYTAIRKAAEAGMGIAELPAFVAQEFLHSGRLVRVLDDWAFSACARDEPDVTLWAVVPSRQNLSRLVHLFRSYCTKAASESF